MLLRRKVEEVTPAFSSVCGSQIARAAFSVPVDAGVPATASRRRAAGSASSLEKEPANSLTFPHPKSRERHGWEIDESEVWQVLCGLRRRTVDITDERQCEDEVNGPKDRAFDGVFHDLGGCQPMRTASCGAMMQRRCNVPVRGASASSAPDPAEPEPDPKRVASGNTRGSQRTEAKEWNGDAATTELLFIVRTVAPATVMGFCRCFRPKKAALRGLTNM